MCFIAVLAALVAGYFIREYRDQILKFLGIGEDDSGGGRRP